METGGGPAGIWSARANGRTGGLLHRNKEHLALFGLYTACTPPPPKPHAYTQLKNKENYKRSKGKDQVT